MSFALFINFYSIDFSSAALGVNSTYALVFTAIIFLGPIVLGFKLHKGWKIKQAPVSVLVVVPPPQTLHEGGENEQEQDLEKVECKGDADETLTNATVLNVS